jgi:hypothetical protein
VFYNSVRLSPVSVGPLQGRFSFGIGLPRSIWFSVFFHTSFFWLLIQSGVGFDGPEPVRRTSTLSVKMLSQGGGAPTTLQTPTTERPPTVLTLAPSAAAESPFTSSNAIQAPNPTDNPAGVFGGGSRRRAFSAGGDRFAAPVMQYQGAQEAERRLRETLFARQQIEIFLRGLSNSVVLDQSSGRCRLDRDISCDIQNDMIRSRLIAFWGEFRARHPFIESVEFTLTGNQWMLSDLRQLP